MALQMDLIHCLIKTRRCKSNVFRRLAIFWPQEKGAENLRPFPTIGYIARHPSRALKQSKGMTLDKKDVQH